MSRNTRKAIPLNELSDLDREKILKVGMRGYEYCEQTGKRIFEVDKAYYDSKSDCVFVNFQAFCEWTKDNLADKINRIKEKEMKRKMKEANQFNILEIKKKNKKLSFSYV